ncbi:HIT domain-containing protein [bacterium]|nr:HIT domain-containing protein [bacterium]
MPSNLWAPWRYPWIKASKDGVHDCFLCDALRDDSAMDRDNLVLFRGDSAFVILNRYPYSNGHLMVVPNRHVHDLRQVSGEEAGEMHRLVQQSLDAMHKSLGPHGFNLGYNLGRVSGAGLEEHLHMHIVPRWNGDTNFMPVVGDVKVISQDLYDSYDQLWNAWHELQL